MEAAGNSGSFSAVSPSLLRNSARCSLLSLFQEYTEVRSLGTSLLHPLSSLLHAVDFPPA